MSPGDPTETESFSDSSNHNSKHNLTMEAHKNCSPGSCYCWSLFLFESRMNNGGITAYNDPKLSDFLCFWSNNEIDTKDMNNNFLKSILVRLSQNLAEKRLSFVH